MTQNTKPASSYFHKIRHKLSQYCPSLWVAECLKTPGQIGAVSPSSKALGRTMAALVPDYDGLVLEFGAGTGAITKCLLASGVPPEKLVSIERSENLARHLTKCFPQITVLCQDVLTIEECLPNGCRVSAIVSGLPLRSLPQHVVEGVVKLANRLLEPHGGKLIQFTYALFGGSPYLSADANFERLEQKYVWFNLPPARVEVFGVRPSVVNRLDNQFSLN